jgi:hypothetical protein
MATAHLPPESGGVIQSDHFPPAAAARVAASLLNRHSAHEIAEAIEVLVDVLDLIGGDADEEVNGDELDGTNAEDEVGNNHLSGVDMGAGCPIADPGGCEHDGREPDHDAEVETWSHWMDHPPELHIGTRPGHTGKDA